MRQLNIKILLAPILAITLALLIAGAITSLPFIPTDDLQSSPQPTAGTLGTSVPQAASMAASPLPTYFIGGAIIVCVLAVLLFFREKNIDK